MPLLAPLIYRMSTQDVEYRFTAAEALAFCRYIRLTYSDLSADLPSQLHPGMEVGKDPWRYLPNEYAQQWLPQGEGWANVGLEDALQLTPDGHADRPSKLNNLGNSLQKRL
jgi:hypothetical protein